MAESGEEGYREPDLDIESLMARIREAAARRRTAHSSVPGQLRHVTRQPSLDLAQLYQNIGSAAALAESINTVPIRASGRKGAVELAVKKAIKWVVHWNTREQAQFNGLVIRILDLIAKRVRAWQQSLETQRELYERQEAISTRISSMDQEMADLSKSLRELWVKFDQAEKHLASRFDELTMRILRMERSLAETGTNVRASAPVINVRRTEPPDATSPVPGGDPTRPGLDYFEFERQFRGPSESVKRGHSIHLDWFAGVEHVVDLGCGRGEFLDLLRECGIRATGVDLSEDMTDFCRERGLEVNRADVFEYLQGQPDDSIPAVFASQIVEHMPPESILILLDLFRRKLVPGGIAVIETINIECPEGLRNFFLDPSHVRPVPAQLLRFIAEQASLTFNGLKFSSPVNADVPPVLETDSPTTNDIRSYQDYSVLLKKPLP